MHRGGLLPVKKKPPAPDGGYGWVVVFASFMIHIIVDGLTSSAGVYMTEFTSEFQIGLGLTSGVLALMTGLSRFSGPSTGIFVTKWGSRRVSACGALLAALGLGLGYFAQHISHLYLTFGLLLGLGRGLIYLPSVVIVSNYFDKKRSFAIGISMCGSGIGALAFAPLQTWLISLYGWRITLLIASGLQAQCVFFSLLYKPLPELSPNPSSISIKLPSTAIEPVESQDQENLDPVTSSEVVQEETDDSAKLVSDVPPPPPGPTTEPAPGSDIQPVVIPAARRRSSARSLPLRRTVSARSSQQLYIKGSYSGGSLSTADLRLSGESIRSEEPAKRTCCQRTFCHPKLWSKVKQVMAFSLLKRPVFVFFVLANFLYAIGENIPNVYIIDLAINGGSPNNAATSFLLSIIGISGTLSRIPLGYLSDRPWFKRFYLYIFGYLFGGVATGIASHFTDIISLRVFAAVSGVTTGIYVGLTSVVLVDLLGLKKLSSAYGFVLFSRGVATFIGAPMVGKLFDDYRDFRIGFWLVAGIMIFGGILLFFIPCFPKRVTRGLEGADEVTKSTEKR